MAYFPQTIMPKHLRKEKSSEVDGSPSIYNAKDYNTHHREILAIEQALIGTTGDENAPNSIDQAVSLLENLLDGITLDGIMTRAVGNISSGQKIQIPSTILHTKTTGVLATNATTISVESTAGFSSSGYLTKINALPMSSNTAYYLNGNNSFQEVISYTAIVGNTFTGCTRSVFGTDAQALPYANFKPIAGNDGTKAVIIGGRASLSYYPLSINHTGSAQNQMTLWHEADLTLGLATMPSAALQGHIGYSLMVIGQLPKIDLSGLFAG